MALISAAQFKAHYPQLTGNTEDTVIDGLIAEADDLMAAYAGYPEADIGGHTFEDVTYTLFLDRPSPIEPAVICVCVHPIVSITSLHVDALRVYGAGTLLSLNTDYTFDIRDGMIILTPSSTFSFPTAFRAIKVVLVAGYAVTPPGLRILACLAVRHLWNLRNVQGQSAYGIGGDSATLTDAEAALPASVKEGLRAYMTPCAAALQEAA